jgi:hypothetical protein
MSLDCSCFRGLFKFDGSIHRMEIAYPRTLPTFTIHKRMSIQNQRFVFLVLHAI